MKTQLEVKILTPNTVVLNQVADMVIIPSVDGELGVLAEHIPLISNLSPGLIKLYKQDNIERVIFVYGGFARITNNTLNILVTQYNNLMDLDPTKAAAEIPVFEEKLSTTSSTEYRELMFKEISLRRKIIEACKSITKL
jgi:F-type H+-transporting ATPase subunit epsilon